MRLQVIASLLFLFPAVLAAAPGTQPADPWLARAEREIDLMPADPQQDLQLPQARDLGIMLYRLAPTDDRRARELRLIDAFLKIELANSLSAEQIQGTYVAAAFTHAQLDDLAGARRFLADADRPAHAPPTTNPWVKAGSGFIAMFRAETYVRLGDFAAFEKVGLNPFLGSLVASDLADDGLNAQAKWVNEWIARQPKPISTQPGDLGALADPPGRLKVQSMIADGDLPGAARAAGRIENEVPPDPDGTRMGGFFACEAELVVARACVDAADLPTFRAAREAFVSLVRKHPTDGNQNFHAFLKLCVRANDRAGFEEVAGAWESDLQPLASQSTEQQLNYVEQTAMLAFESAAIADLPRYRSAVDRAENVLAGVRINYEAAKSAVEEHAACFLWIAAARARAGDSAGVARDEDASRRAGALDAEQWDEPWSNVVYGYADAGQFHDALAAAASARDDPYKSLPAYIARRQAQAGRFADAWKTLAPLPGRARSRGQYDLIVRQVRAGQTDGLASRIDAMPSPAERALADIAVGGTLLNRPFVGLLRMYAPKED